MNNPNEHTFTVGCATQIADKQGSNGTAATSACVSSGAAGKMINVAAQGVVNAFGGTGYDALTGSSANNWLAGGPGSDAVNTVDGDDVLLIDRSDLQATLIEAMNLVWHLINNHIKSYTYELGHMSRYAKPCVAALCAQCT